MEDTFGRRVRRVNQRNITIRNIWRIGKTCHFLRKHFRTRNARTCARSGESARADFRFRRARTVARCVGAADKVASRRARLSFSRQTAPAFVIGAIDNSTVGTAGARLSAAYRRDEREETRDLDGRCNWRHFADASVRARVCAPCPFRHAGRGLPRGNGRTRNRIEESESQNRNRSTSTTTRARARSSRHF